MTGLPDTVEELLLRLADASRSETDIVRALADQVRRADEQLLREVRNVSIHHEMRREEILTELHTLAMRLCAIPARPLPPVERPAIHHRPSLNGFVQPAPSVPESPSSGGDWRRAAKKIDEELDLVFGENGPRH